MDALSRVVAVVNGKGGVLKTSVVANVGGYLAAKGGMRVLLVDLDVQGNLKFDLGLVDSPEDDGGRSVLDAVWSGTPLKVVTGVRPRLDFVFGGRNLEVLTSLSHSQIASDLPGGGVPGSFALRLAEVAGDYDMVLLDCPPGSGEIQDMALRAARWALIPTKTDDASLDGLLAVGPRVRRAREKNPMLDWLGVVITAHTAGASRILRDTLATLDEVSDTLSPFDSRIRHSEATARDCRSRGQLAHELAKDVSSAPSQRIEALKARARVKREDNVVFLPEVPETLAKASVPLADDYRLLAEEICARIAAAEQHAIAEGQR